MRTRKRDGSDERRILIGMIVDRTVIARISSFWKEGLFKSKWSSLIGGWCVEYFNQYDEAPGDQIESLFGSWASDSTEEETIDLIEKFLTSLSSEYDRLTKQSNSQYVLDLANKHFNQVRLQKLAEEIQGDIAKGKVLTARSRVDDFDSIEVGQGSYVDPFDDKEAVRQAFESKSEPLIRFKGALGAFFRDDLERDGFIAFMAPEKRGKSFWLIHLAFTGIQQKRRVAYFQVGDMSQDQVMRRIMARIARRPLKARSVQYPRSIAHHPDADEAEVVLEERVFKTGLDWGMAYDEAIDMKKSGLLRLSTHPADSLTVSGLRGVLASWDNAGWTPDIVVIDYADILADNDDRIQINKTWKQLRSISQELHCLVATATQSDAESAEATLLGRKHFSEDKRKYAHVTAMYGINQTNTEKELGLFRLNKLVLREDEFVITKCVHTAGCLAIANPAIRSTF